MSAKVVEPAHIDVMLSVAINGPKGVPIWRWTAPCIHELIEGDEHTGPVTPETADLAGRALLAECIASVSFLCPKHSPGQLPGPIPNPKIEQYEWTDLGEPLTIVETLKAIDGFEYQSCEHPGWWDSGANYFCHRFRKELIRLLRGYEESQWTWTPESALAGAEGS